jgi:hypothetical protein
MVDYRLASIEQTIENRKLKIGNAHGIPPCLAGWLTVYADDEMSDDRLLVATPRLPQILFNGNPRLAEPRLGLNYIRCFAAC